MLFYFPCKFKVSTIVYADLRMADRTFLPEGLQMADGTILPAVLQRIRKLKHPKKSIKNITTKTAFR